MFYILSSYVFDVCRMCEESIDRGQQETVYKLPHPLLTWVQYPLAIAIRGSQIYPVYLMKTGLVLYRLNKNCEESGLYASELSRQQKRFREILHLLPWDIALVAGKLEIDSFVANCSLGDS